MDKKDIGKRLMKLRLENGNPSRRDVAKSVFLAEESYANIERGSQNTSLDSTVRLAKYYGVSLDYLVLGKEKEGDESQIVHILTTIYEKNLDIEQKLDMLLYLIQPND